MNGCKFNVFTSNIIMVLHHKKSKTVKIKVNRHTNISLLMNLFTMNQSIFIFPILYFYSYKYLFNHFVFSNFVLFCFFFWQFETL